MCSYNLLHISLLESSLEEEPLLDKLSVKAMYSTETDFSPEVENNQENQYYYIEISPINYESAWKYY